jgi:hypothetical protein
MTDINDKSRAELEAMLAEVQAALAARAEIEPDARKLVVTRILGAYHMTRISGGPVEDFILLKPAVQEAFAALRRGMELAPTPAEPVDVVDVLQQINTALGRLYQQRGCWPGTLSIMDVIRPILREALANRSARWPGDQEIADMAHAIIEEQEMPITTAFQLLVRMARRLRAHMTGETK